MGNLAKFLLPAALVFALGSRAFGLAWTLRSQAIAAEVGWRGGPIRPLARPAVPTSMGPTKLLAQEWPGGGWEGGDDVRVDQVQQKGG